MNEKNDFELLEIVMRNRSKYVTEAITAAEAEIKKRNLNIEEVLRLVEESKIANKSNRQSGPFNKSYVYAGLILIFPVLILTISFYKEVVFNIFLIPIGLVSFLPCGLIGFGLAKSAHNSTNKGDLGLNHIVGILEMAFGVLITTIGIIGVFFIIAIVGR